MNDIKFSTTNIAKIGLNTVSQAGQYKDKSIALADGFLKSIEEKSTNETERKLAHYAREAAAKGADEGRFNYNALTTETLALEVLASGINGPLGKVLADIAEKTLEASGKYYNSIRTPDDSVLGKTYLNAISQEGESENVKLLAHSAAEIAGISVDASRGLEAERNALRMITEGNTKGLPEVVLAKYAVTVPLTKEMAGIITEDVLKNAKSEKNRIIAELGKEIIDTSPPLYEYKGSDAHFNNTSSRQAPHLNVLSSEKRSPALDIINLLNINISSGRKMEKGILDKALADIEEKGATGMEKAVAHYAKKAALEAGNEELACKIEEAAIKNLASALNLVEPVSTGHVLANISPDIMRDSRYILKGDELQKLNNTLLDGISRYSENENERLLASVALKLPEGSSEGRGNALNLILRKDYEKSSPEEMLSDYGYRFAKGQGAGDVIIQSIIENGKNKEVKETLGMIKELYEGEAPGGIDAVASSAFYFIQDNIKKMNNLFVREDNIFQNTGKIIGNTNSYWHDATRVSMADKFLGRLEKEGPTENQRKISHVVKQAMAEIGDKEFAGNIATSAIYYLSSGDSVDDNFAASLARVAHSSLSTPGTRPSVYSPYLEAGKVYFQAIKDDPKSSESEKLLAQTALEASEKFTDSKIKLTEKGIGNWDIGYENSKKLKPFIGKEFSREELNNQLKDLGFDDKEIGKIEKLLIKDCGKVSSAYDAQMCALGLMDNRDSAHYFLMFKDDESKKSTLDMRSSKKIHELRPDGVLAAYGHMLSGKGDEPVNREVMNLILDKIIEHGKDGENRTLAQSAKGISSEVSGAETDVQSGIFRTIFEKENKRTSGIPEAMRKLKFGLSDLRYAIRDKWYKLTC